MRTPGTRSYEPQINYDYSVNGVWFRGDSGITKKLFGGMVLIALQAILLWVIR